MTDLKKAREEINKIDCEMAELFERRMKAVESVAAYKQAHGLPILDPTREEEIITRGSERVADTTLRAYYVEYLRDVMKISRRYQHRLSEGMRVAFSGVSGAFAAIAAEKIFPDAEHISYPNFRAAYDAVVTSECDVAVLPIENSTAGEVGQVMDMLFSGSLYVNGVFDLSINHCLMALPGADEDSVREVISHPQALAQCAPYLRDRGYRQTQFENTARAAQFVAESGDTTLAAIASEETAALFGLRILARNINSSGVNTTRFAVLSRVREESVREDGKHSILMFTVRNEAGALARVIGIIGRYGYNMRCLRSRPMKELSWQYYFYVEAEGDLGSEKGRRMMAELTPLCDRLRMLGTFRYPAVLGGEGEE